jgi:hypothetical protein
MLIWRKNPQALQAPRAAPSGPRKTGRFIPPIPIPLPLILLVPLLLLGAGCPLDSKPNRELTSIQVTTPPTGNTTLGEALNLEGMVITGVYNDGSTGRVNYTPQDVTGFNPDRLGPQELTVTIQGKTAQFTIRVEPVEIRVLNVGTGHKDEEAKLWEPFAAAHPGIRITREDVTKAAYPGSIADIRAEDPPDVIYAWAGGPSQRLHTEQLLKDLTPLRQGEDLFSSFYHVLYPDAQRGGYRGIIPLGIRVANLFYINRKVLLDCGLGVAEDYPR